MRLFFVKEKERRENLDLTKLNSKGGGDVA
nr:MAG TPA: hypothetical protein [Caudoviricetes sp.]